MLKLRQSILNSYETCRFMCKQEWGEVGVQEPHDDTDAPQNKYSATGICLHQVMEQWGIDRMIGEQHHIVFYHDLLDTLFAAIPLELFKDQEDNTKYFNSLHEQLTWLLEQSEGTIPIEVEESFLIEGLISNCYPISGTMDRADGSIANKDVTLVDYKSGKVYTKKELKDNMQAGIYALAFYSKYKFFPKRFIFMFSKHKKLKVIEITPEFITNSTTRILSNWLHMKNGDWTPNNSNKFFCNNFCNCKKICPKYSKTNILGWTSVGFEIYDESDNLKEEM